MIQPSSWRTYLASLGYLLVYAIPAIPIISVQLGQITHHPNIFAALPLVIRVVALPLLQTIFPFTIPPLPKEILTHPNWQTYYRTVLRLSVFLQLGMLWVTLQLWTSEQFNLWGSLIYLVSVGIFSGTFAMLTAHELVHYPQKLDQVVSGILLSTIAFGSFKIVHLRIHHRYVATPQDFVTAQRGQTLYAFCWKNLIGNFWEAIQSEREDLARRGQSLWHSELLIWYGLSLLWLSLAILLAGWKGGLFWGLQSLIAILSLEWTDYLQHYGLTRKLEKNGRYESVKIHHAWSQERFIDDLVFLNLFRHGDHHANPQRPYQALSHAIDVPRYPYDLGFMYLLALVPPLFHRIVHPVLDRFEAEQQ